MGFSDVGTRAKEGGVCHSKSRHFSCQIQKISAYRQVLVNKADLGPIYWTLFQFVQCFRARGTANLAHANDLHKLHTNKLSPEWQTPSVVYPLFIFSVLCVNAKWVMGGKSDSSECLPVCKPYHNLKLLDNAVFFSLKIVCLGYLKHTFTQRGGGP